MGILTRQQGVRYVITTDQVSGDVSTKRAPRFAKTYEVWTGSDWSAEMADATTFESLDDADEYVRANYTKLSARPKA